ncbi:sulfur carrier protein ThiS [Mumia zhuanghuii]|uniref:Sulfur carrier protein ThiS n=2 Tax=Mumia TaxID=1546255 RepID=A0ABW1QG52_9ACTN|nr:MULTISPECIES: sulfur carrier protein ThiS [Mumia]KAA1422912.1 sulfur carrier protein ThiS [Mumia zhuanghuii]
MTIRLNGSDHVLPGPTTVLTLVDRLDLGRTDLAVAVDGAVVPRSEWADHTIPDGADVDVVTAVQGG